MYKRYVRRYLCFMKYTHKLFAAAAAIAAAGFATPAFADGGSHEQVDTEEHDGDVETHVEDHEVAPAPETAPVEEPAVDEGASHVDESVEDSSTTDSSTTDNSTVDNSTTDNSVVNNTTIVEAPETTAGTAVHTNPYRDAFTKFNSFGVGVGGSFVRTDEVGGEQSFKLDFNAGPLYVNYYTKAVFGGGFMPVFPVYSDRIGFGAGVGVAYHRNDDVPGVDHINIMYVHVPAALDFRLIGGLHLRGGPSFFVPTNVGNDVNGLDRDDRREAWKHPRGDISLRWQF